ncbi:Hypothetical protein PHPALM_17827 [Phytophthora palmivora]|uniref:Transmembrane protein n=1 Tax=Phytophthora palmivora TaxID=4796 RepID=A0A2P4XL83_9STRA|nr:Hypothetical protein PHPALM_17827 [Phytophthora palmivora]
MLLIECIPLKGPEEGWKANWTMWVRVMVASIFVGGGIVFLSRAIIEEGKISVTRAIGITIVSAILYAALGCLLAATWKYPIPFGMVLMVCPFVSIIMNLILLSIDFKDLKTNKKLRKQLVGHIIGSSAQSLLVVAYPTFNAVFLHLSGSQQAIFMLVLPVIKFITKQIIAKVATYLEDYIGVVIVFSVDVFNVLYVAICMQTARSSLTTILVMSSDILQIFLALRNVYYHTNHILQQHDKDKGNVPYVDKILLSVAQFQPRKNPYSGPIRLFMPYKVPLSATSRDLLENVERKWNRNEGNLSCVKLEKSIKEGLQVLFYCEYVIMSEYIECILPLVYAGYLSGLYRLPTAAYYPFTRSLTPTKMRSTLIQLIMYGSLEFWSFVGLHVLLKKRLGYSPVYQLAFVLETHVIIVQSLLFIWIIFIVQLTLVHAGVDFNAPFQ